VTEISNRRRFFSRYSKKFVLRQIHGEVLPRSLPDSSGSASRGRKRLNKIRLGAFSVTQFRATAEIASGSLQIGVSTASGLYCETSMPRKLTPPQPLGPSNVSNSLAVTTRTVPSAIHFSSEAVVKPDHFIDCVLRPLDYDPIVSSPMISSRNKLSHLRLVNSFWECNI